MTGREARTATVAILTAVTAAVLAAPTALGEGQLPPPPPSCLTVGCEPAVEAVVDRVSDLLTVRLSRTDEAAPREIAKTIVAEAGDARIDPLLVLAMIEVESSYDPCALSSRGARGLMQLLEPTMRQELERGGIEYGDPHDPIANVQAGIRYLRRLLDAFGREDVALMAYNAGPNRILGFLRDGGIPDRFRAYPRRVRAELRRLHREAGGPEAPLVAEAHIPPAAQ